MPDTSTLGAFVRSARTEANLSIRDLAARAGVGARTLGDIERGVARTPQIATLIALADALGLVGAARRKLLGIRAAREAGSSTSGSVPGAPLRTDGFAGRVAELAYLDEAIAREQVVVVSGPPGVGKSALTIEAAARSGRKAVFVALSGQSPSPREPLEVLQDAIMQISGEDAPATLEAASTVWRALSAKTHPLLVLDDAGEESQVRSLLASGTGATVLVTARGPLAGLTGTQHLPVAPLDPVAARAVLRNAAADVDGTAVGAEYFDELIDACAGSPLALRLVGRRLASAPGRAAAYARRVSVARDRLDALQDSERSVEAAVDSSYSLLDPVTAALFRSLAAISGPSFSPALVVLATGDDLFDVEDGLERLVDLGLLEALAGGRYRMHDLLRLFADRRGYEVDGLTAVRARRTRLHEGLTDVLGEAAGLFAPDGGPTDRFADPAAARSWITEESDHWWGAVISLGRVGDAERVLDTASALQWFSNLWPAWGHWHDLFGVAVEAAASVHDEERRSEHLGHRTWAALMERGDRPLALHHAEESLSAARAAASATRTTWGHYHVAWARLALREPAAALPHIEEAVDGFTRLDDQDNALQARSMAGAAQHLLGDHRAAIRAFDGVLTALAGRSDQGASFTRVVALEELAKSHVALGEPVPAIEAAETALGVAEDMQWDTGRVRLLRQRAEANVLAGKKIEGRRDAEVALSILDPDREDAQAAAVRAELLALLADLDRPAAAGADQASTR